MGTTSRPSEPVHTDWPTTAYSTGCPGRTSGHGSANATSSSISRATGSNLNNAWHTNDAWPTSLPGSAA